MFSHSRSSWCCRASFHKYVRHCITFPPWRLSLQLSKQIRYPNIRSLAEEELQAHRMPQEQQALQILGAQTCLVTVINANRSNSPLRGICRSSSSPARQGSNDILRNLMGLHTFCFPIAFAVAFTWGQWQTPTPIYTHIHRHRRTLKWSYVRPC